MATDQQPPIESQSPPIEARDQLRPTEERPPVEQAQPGSKPIPPPVLPDKNISPETFEDAYISFILYCNPALPPDCDINSLREAFAVPPRSQGKDFSPWLVFDKVKKFYDKEIPSWTEMVIQLGVDPPNPSKDESAQKLTQYGVRLKKWLQSYHVKPFFEYLMDIPNEYWTDIPTGSDPTSMAVRDGIQLEDDMVLRALLPHMRPKRGRTKRPTSEQDVSTPLSARPVRFVSSPWTASAPTPLSAHPGNTPGSGQPLLAPNDGSHTPLSRYPSSAVTPTTRNGLWDSPSTPRRGAKGVSSAWKVAGQNNGKTRGRPPIERKSPSEGPFSAWPSNPEQPPKKRPRHHIDGATTPVDAPGFQTPVPTESPSVASIPATQPPILDRTASAPVPAARSWSASDGPRPPRPSISLQVPQRTGGSVRLATPPLPTAPPAVMVNGEHQQQQQPPPPPPPTYQPSQTQPHTQPYQHPPAQSYVQPQEHPQYQPYEHPSTHLPQNTYYDSTKESNTANETGSTVPQDGTADGSDVEDYYFEKIPERTNVDTLLSFFMRATQDGQWFDHTGAPAEPATMDEAAAITNCTLQAMLKTASTPQAFLINLGALAGARTLMTTRPKYYRMPDGEDCHNYKFEWEYRFGHFKGHFDMTQRVPWTMWKKPAPSGSGEAEKEMEGETGMSAEQWKGKYQSLLGEMKKREQELADLRGKVMSSLREDLT